MAEPLSVRRSSNQGLDASLRGHLETNADIVTRITKPVRMDDIGALSAQSDQPILFENIVEKPGFRLCDILVKNRALAGARARRRSGGLSQDARVSPAPAAARLQEREVRPGEGGGQAWRRCRLDQASDPVPQGQGHGAVCDGDEHHQDPETGFYNSCHAGTHAVGPRRGLISFVTPHSHVIMRKYREMGAEYMPIAFVFGVPPAYEIMANFSGLHMDSWGEMEMVGTIMDRDVEMVPCETLDLTVPAEAEIVVEGRVKLNGRFRVGDVTSPSMYHLPHYEELPEVEITAITMRGGPADLSQPPDHARPPTIRPLPRLCHEAVLYNRLTEIGLDVKDVRFPTWGAALSCILQFDYPREGFVNDALMTAMGAPWLNTKMVVAVSPDTDLDDPGDVYHAIATRCDPSRDIIIVGNTRGSPYDPSAKPIEGQHPWRVVGKIGIDATVKSRHDPADFERAWPRNWGKVKLEDYL